MRLREWGTDRIYGLPRPPVRDWFIGTSKACALRLIDRSVAPRHAELLYERQQWHLRDLAHSMGLRDDGERCNELVLRPGVEIGVGATTLIAESPRFIALREFCSRILGWGGDRMRAVDHALRAIRLATSQRSALILRGEGDLVPIAHALHRHVLGDEAPFIVCDRRRRNGSASVRSPAGHASAVAAHKVATTGSLCMRHSRLPADLPLLLKLHREPDSRVQLIVCEEARTRSCVLAGLTGLIPIEVPSLGIREIELPRIVDEYVNDAIVALRPPREWTAHFADEDRWWVMDHAARSLSEIEKATFRIVALRISVNKSQAAARLGMAPVSLSRWLARHPPLPVPARAAPAGWHRDVSAKTSQSSTSSSQPTPSNLPKSRFCWRCENQLENAPHILVKALFGLVWVHVKCGELMARDGEVEEPVRDGDENATKKRVSLD